MPKDLDLTPLIGKELWNIRVGRHNLGLDLWDSDFILIESSWQLTSTDGTVIDESNRPDGIESLQGWKLLGLLNDPIRATEVDPPTSITLVFESGQRLTIFDDSYQFESFQIQVAPALHVIV